MRTTFNKGIRAIKLDKREIAVIREARSLLAEIGRAASCEEATSASIEIEKAMPLIDATVEAAPDTKPGKKKSEAT